MLPSLQCPFPQQQQQNPSDAKCYGHQGQDPSSAQALNKLVHLEFLKTLAPLKAQQQAVCSPLGPSASEALSPSSEAHAPPPHVSVVPGLFFPCLLLKGQPP